MSEKKKGGCGKIGCLGLLVLIGIGLIGSLVNKQPSPTPVDQTSPSASVESSEAIPSSVKPSQPSSSLTTRTPATVSFQRIVRDRTLWPRNIVLRAAIIAPAVLDGKVVGSVTIPAGQSIQLVAVESNGVLDVAWNGARTTVSADKTNIVQAATQQQARANEEEAAQEAQRSAEDALPTPSQGEANAFYGISEQELIQRLGRPLNVSTKDSPDGPFKMLEYSKTEGKETFFVVFASDGKVDSGSYHGVMFSKETGDREKVINEFGDMPISSPWDGSVSEVKDYLKQNLKDPDSTEYIQWYPVVLMDLPDGKAWGVKVKFRSKNSFGGYEAAVGLAAIRNGQVIKFAIDE